MALQAMFLVVKSAQFNESFFSFIQKNNIHLPVSERGERAALVLRRGNADTAACHLVELVTFLYTC